jgi:hypothetical protein
VFSAIVDDLRMVLRPPPPAAQPSAVIDSQTVQSTPQSGARDAAFDRAKSDGSQTSPAMVDTLNIGSHYT